jgi:hypothetical protein
VQIPSSLRLMGHTVTVEVIPPIRWKNKGCVGMFFPDEMRIIVRKGTPTTTEHSFMHELAHAILYCMNSDLYDDEVFVDTFAGLAHQALTSAKFSEPRHPRRSRKAKP